MASGPVDVRWVSPGRAVAEAVSAAVRELQGDDPLRLVRVVAADGATVDGLRRALPLAGGSCGADIGGTLRLATAIAGPALGERRMAPPVAVLAAVQRVLGDPATRPAAFATCAHHPATHDAVVRSLATLDGAFTLPGDPLARLTTLAGGRESALAVCQVVALVREQLLAQGLVDAAEVVRLATARLVDAEPDADVDAVPLVLVVTQQFNPAHVELLRALVARSPRAVLVASTSRAPDLSVGVHVERLVGHPVELVEHRPSTVTPTVVSCPDHDEEVREVTRRVVALLESGVVADRIAVFYPPAGPHRSAIAASLAAAGIAARGQVSPRLEGSVAGQVLRLLMAQVTDGLQRRTLVELARVAPFGRDVAPDGTVRTFARRADQWNRYAQRFGVVGERDWEVFESLLPDPEHPDHRRHSTLVRFVHLQRLHRDAVRTASDWRTLSAALETWFTTHCGTVEWRLQTWKGFPAWQLEAAEQVEGLFAELAAIDTFGLALRPGVAARLVSAFLDTDVTTAESKGAGVFVDQIVGATGAVFDHAFVLGANDHLLPGRVADDLVLTRAHGPEPLGVLTGPANRPLRDRRGFAAALDGAAHSVTVLHSRWDVRSGGELYPSRLLPTDDVVHQHVASHAAQVLSDAQPWLDADEWYARHPELSVPRLARRRRAITARAQDRPGEFDGQVGALGAADPLTRTDAEGARAQTGITSFEEWVGCGLRYFVTRVLGARTDDIDPSELTDIDPREKGTLIHAVFERLIVEWLSAHPEATRPWITDEADIERTMERAVAVLDDLAADLLDRHRLGHVVMWRARRAQILAAIRRGLEAERADGAVPLAAELAFGRRAGPATPPVVWHAPDGSFDVHFQGSVDRLDRLGDGSLRVMDLKSGRSTDYRSISALAPLGPDRDKLQLAFYGWALEQLRGEPVASSAYRFVGRPEQDADVVLELTDDVRDELHRRVHEIAVAIGAGRFEPGPVGTWGCDVCAPDGLGVSEIDQRRFEWSGELEALDGWDDPTGDVR